MSDVLPPQRAAGFIPAVLVRRGLVPRLGGRLLGLVSDGGVQLECHVRRADLRPVRPGALAQRQHGRADAAGNHAAARRCGDAAALPLGAPARHSRSTPSADSPSCCRGPGRPLSSSGGCCCSMRGERRGRWGGRGPAGWPSRCWPANRLFSPTPLWLQRISPLPPVCWRWYYHFRAGRDGPWLRRVGWPALWFAAAVLAKASGLVFGVPVLDRRRGGTAVVIGSRSWRAGG